MSHKEQHGNKESKKAPAHSVKEKKQMKRAKKQDKGATPLLPAHH